MRRARQIEEHKAKSLSGKAVRLQTESEYFLFERGLIVAYQLKIRASPVAQ